MESVVEKKVLTGGCHCGNIRYRFVTVKVGEALSARRCECSFCRRHGAVYTSEPSGEVRFEFSAPDSIHPYRFATQAVDFLICADCGVMTAALSGIDDITYAVINANTLDERIGLSQGTVDYSGETPQQGRERRKRNWIGRVELYSQGDRLESQWSGAKRTPSAV